MISIWSKKDWSAYKSGYKSNQRNHKKTTGGGYSCRESAGVQFGRTIKEVPENFEELVKQWEHKQIKITELLKLCNMGRSTFKNGQHDVV